MRSALLLATITITFASNVQAQVPKPAVISRTAITMERFEGPSVTIDLGYGIVVNKASTLRREWFVLRDESAPALLDGPTGVSVSYKSGDRSSLSQYQYRIPYQIKAKESIAAIEIRVHVLDVFGRLLKTLSATEVEDFSDVRSFDATWRVWSENEASEAFASVAYIAQVRTASGKVYEADRTAVFDQVRKVAKRITEADLEPKREQPAK